MCTEFFPSASAGSSPAGLTHRASNPNRAGADDRYATGGKSSTSRPLATIACNSSVREPIASQFREDDKQDKRSSVGCVCSASRLYWFDEVPAVLQYNKYVAGGYRAGLSKFECFQSLFQYHNETGNILTHLVPLLLWTSALLTGWLQPWPEAKIAFYENILPIFFCLCGSLTYHIFMANHWSYKQWLFVDVCGIFVLCLGGITVVLSWGLFCYPALRHVFMISYYSCAALCVVGGLKAKSALARGIPLLMLFTIRLLVLALRWILHSGSSAATLHYAIMEGLCVLGGVINAFRIPEKWFGVPGYRKHGYFDYWLNSHQLMHILVVLGMLHLHWGATLDYQYFRTHPTCPHSEHLAFNLLHPLHP